MNKKIALLVLAGFLLGGIVKFIFSQDEMVGVLIADRNWIVLLKKQEGTISSAKATIDVSQAGMYKVLLTDFVPRTTYYLYLGTNLLGTFLSSDAGTLYNNGITFSAGANLLTISQTVVVPPPPSGCEGDFNNDKIVDIFDFVIFGQVFGSRKGEAKYRSDADFVKTGDSQDKIDVYDLVYFGRILFGKSCGTAAPSYVQDFELQIEDVRIAEPVFENYNSELFSEISEDTMAIGATSIKLAGLKNAVAVVLEIETGPEVISCSVNRQGEKDFWWADVSPSFQAGKNKLFLFVNFDEPRSGTVDLANLLLIFGTARRSEIKLQRVYCLDSRGKISEAPGRTFNFSLIPPNFRLCQNYPNPFNPETWIPYQLAEPGEVSIDIFSAQGQLVRSLGMGYKNVGFFITKEKAAYWDGRNGNGERVAEGIYFILFQVRDIGGKYKFFDTGKMVMGHGYQSKSSKK